MAMVMVVAVVFTDNGLAVELVVVAVSCDGSSCGSSGGGSGCDSTRCSSGNSDSEC